MEIGLKMMQILRCIHGKGVFHCDVKPHNRLIGDLRATHKASRSKSVCSSMGHRCSLCRAPPHRHRRRDVQSLCLSLRWLAIPWRGRAGMPSWDAVLQDGVAAHIWGVREDVKDSTGDAETKAKTDSKGPIHHRRKRRRRKPAQSGDRQSSRREKKAAKSKAKQYGKADDEQKSMNGRS